MYISVSIYACCFGANVLESRFKIDVVIMIICSIVIIINCSARDWEQSGLLGEIPRVVVQISALL